MLLPSAQCVRVRLRVTILRDLRSLGHSTFLKLQYAFEQTVYTDYGEDWKNNYSPDRDAAKATG